MVDYHDSNDAEHYTEHHTRHVPSRCCLLVVKVPHATLQLFDVPANSTW